MKLNKIFKALKEARMPADWTYDSNYGGWVSSDDQDIVYVVSDSEELEDVTLFVRAHWSENGLQQGEDQEYMDVIGIMYGSIVPSSKYAGQLVERFIKHPKFKIS